MRGRWTEQEAKFNAPAHPHPLQCAHWSTFPLEGEGPERKENRKPSPFQGEGGPQGRMRVRLGSGLARRVVASHNKREEEIGERDGATLRHPPAQAAKKVRVGPQPVPVPPR